MKFLLFITICSFFPSLLLAEELSVAHINDYEYRLKKNEFHLSLSNSYQFSELDFEIEEKTYLDNSRHAFFLNGVLSYSFSQDSTIFVDEKYYYYQKIRERYHGEYSNYQKEGVTEPLIGLKHYFTIRPDLFYTIFISSAPKLATAKVNNVFNGNENFQFGFIWDYFYKAFEIGGKLESVFIGPTKIKDNERKTNLNSGKYSVFHFSIGIGCKFLDHYKVNVEHGLALYTQREMVMRLSSLEANKGYSYITEIDLLYAFNPKLNIGLNGRFQTEIYNIKTKVNRNLDLEYQDFMTSLKVNYAFN